MVVRELHKVVIIGLGLIGGSMARAMKARDLCTELWAAGHDEAGLKQAVKDTVIDQWSQAPAEYCKGADLIILAVPGLSVEAVLRDIREHLDAETILTDVASVKHSTVSAAEKVLGDRLPQLVPGHPIAGAEKSGYSASLPELFAHRKVLLTPLSCTNPQALATVEKLWRDIGAEVQCMDVEHHDEVLAATSHLPHLLAFALVDTLSHHGEREEIFRYAAGGFRDFTRIASSDPQMWRDVFVANGAATVKVLDQYTQELQSLREALLAQDGDCFLETFTRAKRSRDKFMQQQNATPDQEQHDLVYEVEPGGILKGEFRVPGDKSISHRSIMLGSLAEGITEVEGFLEGEDVLATLDAFRAMGVKIEQHAAGKLVIHGVGLHGLKAPSAPIYLGNSGTGMRLMCGLMAAQSFSSVLTGDSSLSTRPMGRVVKPLQAMGANITLQKGGVSPIEISPATLKGIHYDMPVASAQVKSCLLLAALYAEGETSVTEPAPCRDHTERMLQGFGYQVKVNGSTTSLNGGGTLQAAHIDVPADISSATFFMVGASIAPGSDILLKHVGINPTRIGVINILCLMGADLTLENEKLVGGEPVADIRVRYTGLKGIDIPLEQVPLAIDEFPALFVAAACAEGRTVLRGAEELRVKESDRIQVMADGLKVLGADVEVTPDGLIIEGGELRGGEVDSHGDHRIAMSFAMAGLRASERITILDCNNVATSFPGFVELAEETGVRLTQTRS